jgi:hypothetical protein
MKKKLKTGVEVELKENKIEVSTTKKYAVLDRSTRSVTFHYFPLKYDNREIMDKIKEVHDLSMCTYAVIEGEEKEIIWE